MEPLVLFGALLVVYCGYLAILDTIRDCKIRRTASTAPRAYLKKQAPMFTGECPLRGIAIGRPFLNRV